MPAPNPSNPATLPTIESMQGGDQVSDADLARAMAADEGGEGPDEGDDSDGGQIDVEAQGEDGEEGEEGDEGEGEEDEASGDDAAPVKFKNEEGEEVETTLGDLKAKYQEFGKLQAQFEETRQELGQVGLKAHQLIENNRQQYTQALGKFNDWIMAVVAPEFQNLNMQELADKDPGQYVKVQERVKQVEKVLQGIQQERDQQTRQAQEEGQKARASAVTQAKQVLQKAIPGWNDQLYGNILATAVKSYGFKENEIGNVIDPRLIKMAHDASQWQKLQGSKGVAAKRVATAPARVTKPGQGQVGTQKGGKVMAARKALRQTGSDAAAVNLLMSRGIK
jgi:hypothetical protein